MNDFDKLEEIISHHSKCPKTWGEKNCVCGLAKGMEYISKHYLPLSTLNKECGLAGDNVAIYFHGGCKKKIEIKDAYRCTGCGGWFHKDCILKHFEVEKKHDWGREQERQKIKDSVELWMNTHDKNDKSFTTDDFIKFVLGE